MDIAAHCATQPYSKTRPFELKTDTLVHPATGNIHTYFSFFYTILLSSYDEDI